MRQVESGGVVNKASPDAVISGASRGPVPLAGQVATRSERITKDCQTVPTWIPWQSSHTLPPPSSGRSGDFCSRPPGCLPTSL